MRHYFCTDLGRRSEASKTILKHSFWNEFNYDNNMADNLPYTAQPLSIFEWMTAIKRRDKTFRSIFRVMKVRWWRESIAR